MQQLNDAAACLSNLELDEWSAGELNAEAEARAVQHVQSCSRCRARREAFAREAAEFFREAPSFSRGVAQPRARRVQPRAAIALGAFAALAATVGLLFAPLRGRDTTRAKGTPHIGFFVKRADQVTRGDNGATVYPNDLLRFVYTADKTYYLALFDSDVHATTVYFPSGEFAEAVGAGNDRPLDFSVELDAQLGTERVLALFCLRPFATQPVLSALSAHAPLPAAVDDCQRDELVLHKARR